MSTSKLRVLLLQIRDADDPVLEEERASFAAKSGLEVDQVEPHSLLDGPPTRAQVAACDALMVGGSGDYYVSKGHMPRFDELMRFFVEIVDRGHPTFASCFGFQLMVRALGGEIVHDPEHTELGSLNVYLTDEGKADPLLGTLPSAFIAQLGHKDRADRLPEGYPNLATSPLCKLQAFRVPGKPIWATQFHPELDGLTNKKRYLRYIEGYSEHLTEEEQAKALASYSESPETERLLQEFLQLVFG